MSNELQEAATLIVGEIAKCTKEVLTSDEAAEYMGMSKSYLYKLTMRGEIPHYKPVGKKCYFNRAELVAWLQQNRCATATEIADRANRYTMKGGCTMNNATPTNDDCKVIINLPYAQRAVYDLLKNGGKYSVADISVQLHFSDPRGHIRNLRNKGINILDEWREAESGARYKVYFLPLTAPQGSAPHAYAHKRV